MLDAEQRYDLAGAIMVAKKLGEMDFAGSRRRCPTPTSKAIARYGK